ALSAGRGVDGLDTGGTGKAHQDTAGLRVDETPGRPDPHRPQRHRVVRGDEEPPVARVLENDPAAGDRGVARSVICGRKRPGGQKPSRREVLHGQRAVLAGPMNWAVLTT